MSAIDHLRKAFASRGRAAAIASPGRSPAPGWHMTRCMPAALRTLAFGPLDISYDDRVLEPRPWTAAQSRWAAEVAEQLPPGPLLELCSGAGHIGLLAAHLSSRPITCVDINPAACELIRLNADVAGLDARVDVREGDMTEVLADDEEFALVVADPPWVTTDRVGDFPADPTLAIDGGADGLDLARTCLEVGARHLRRDGFLVLQVGDEQQARSLAAESVRLRLVDLRQKERGVLADRLAPRLRASYALVPAVGLLLAAPLYLIAFTRFDFVPFVCFTVAATSAVSVLVID